MDTTTPLRRKDTTKGPPLRVLSLDGGGVRGYSMLILLQELMYRTYVECEGKAPRRDQIPKPCDHFDLIAGTGTGGLIALMLGRLRLDIETCKDVYVRMTRRVFETDKTFAGIPYRSTLFKASKLEEAIRQCVREHTVFENEGNDGAQQTGSMYSASPVPSSPRTSGPGVQRRLSRSSVSTTGTNPSSPISQRHSAMINGSIWGNPNALLYDNREYRTKTAVTTVYKGTPKDGKSILLRSYDSRKEPPPEFNCKIWEAGRATSATGLAFKPIQIGQHFFLDEGSGTYNPSPEILDEATMNEWPGREIGVFVSIGTGKRPPGTNHLQHEWWEDFFADTLGVFAEARRALISKIEGCEKIHQYMLREHLAKRNVPRENYIRLNVEVGVGEFGMNEWNRLAEISTSTRMYLTKNDVQKMNLDASVKLAKIRRMHKRIQTHATATAESSSDEAEISQLRPYRPVPPIPAPRLPERPSTAPHQQTPSHAPAPPPPSDVVELPGEPISPQHFPLPPATNHPPLNRVSSQDKYAVISSDDYPQPLNIPRPDSQTIHLDPQHHNSNTQQPARQSLDQSSSVSPNLSTDTFNSGPNVPPPVPPKTPIPYPDEDHRNQITPMPIPPRSANRPMSNGYAYKSNPILPYPDDGPPPVVNRQRKPTYTPR